MAGRAQTGDDTGLKKDGGLDHPHHGKLLQVNLLYINIFF